MLNIVSAELMKMKKSKIFIIGTIIVLAMPVFLIIKDFAEPPAEYMNWLYSCFTLNGIVLPIISGFIITILIQREYQDQTIINVLTSPVSRMSFIISKFIAWFLWYAITLLSVVGISILGYYLIYTKTFNIDGIKIFIEYLLKSGLLGFIASLPLFWVAIKQRESFYPSILLALAFAAIQTAGLNISIEMLPLASVVPWSAVTIFSIFDVPSQYKVTCIISILSSGILGFLLSCYTFSKQDQ